MRGGAVARIKEEQETVIRFDATNDDAYVWSADPVFHRRMAKLGVEPVNIGQGVKPGEESRSYRIPKKWVCKVRRPRQVAGKGGICPFSVGKPREERISSAYLPEQGV